jgi:hypothetical protein
MFELRYTHPRSGVDVKIRQAVRIARDQPIAIYGSASVLT